MLLIDSRVWLLWLICCLPWSSANAEKFTVIKGKIEGKPPAREVQLMTVENGVPVKYAGTAIAGNGSFAFMFQPETAGFYYLYDGNGYYRMYIKGGDEIQLRGMDGNWRQTGLLSEENRLLEQWKEREHQLGGVQLWAGDWSRLPEELQVGSIPRFILIDKEGNWVDTEALRPSDPALKKLLENLLKK